VKALYNFIVSCKRKQSPESEADKFGKKGSNVIK